MLSFLKFLIFISNTKPFSQNDQNFILIVGLILFYRLISEILKFIPFIFIFDMNFFIFIYLFLFLFQMNFFASIFISYLKAFNYQFSFFPSRNPSIDFLFLSHFDFFLFPHLIFQNYFCLSYCNFLVQMFNDFTFFDDRMHFLADFSVREFLFILS